LKKAIHDAQKALSADKQTASDKCAVLQEAEQNSADKTNLHLCSAKNPYTATYSRKSVQTARKAWLELVRKRTVRLHRR
jgi:hypothetical protein